MLTFDEDGMLTPGDYPMTIAEIEKSILVVGPENRSRSWDEKWRRSLVKNLGIVAGQLWAVGITEIFIDGSFTQNKDHPNDIDGYFVTTLYRFATKQLQQELNAIEPIWTWDRYARRPHPESPKHELPMWHRYRVDMWPHYLGSTSGIKDEFGNDQEFPAAFRKSRDSFKPRGIVKLEAS